MQIFRVGGSVRDELLGLTSDDADWVVVGATPKQLENLGYQPVGKDFPVFLHPTTKEEYALARTERKTGPGYKGFDVHFAPDVTLEEDLLRRDLTINAMAIDEDGVLVDPHGGQTDLQARLFRHVSAAFVEDPVRILRVARFAARFADFSVANETNQLMKQMVRNGEVNALVPERVWAELERGLMQGHPFRMFEVLDACNALPLLLPGLSPSPHLADALQWAVEHQTELPTRYAVMALQTPDEAAVTALGSKLRLPNDCRDIAVLACREAKSIADAASMGAVKLLGLLERLDALRRPERVPLILDAVLAHTLGGARTSVTRIGDAIAVARGVDAGAIARPLASQGPQVISDAIATARTAALENLLGN
ncbi:MAG: multifunctional CCA tRNA nucleotidyl transferase/2'3'-cyclic phosphodiesterase/2'nucleotidase/phosphatase [Burkholderiaceae bacterium]